MRIFFPLFSRKFIFSDGFIWFTSCTVAIFLASVTFIFIFGYFHSGFSDHFFLARSFVRFLSICQRHILSFTPHYEDEPKKCCILCLRGDLVSVANRTNLQSLYNIIYCYDRWCNSLTYALVWVAQNFLHREFIILLFSVVFFCFFFLCIVGFSQSLSSLWNNTQLFLSLSFGSFTFALLSEPTYRIHQNANYIQQTHEMRLWIKDTK